jgi:SAM-dependent methyltransferase
VDEERRVGLGHRFRGRLRSARRLAARFALVEEEREARTKAITTSSETVLAQIARLREDALRIQREHVAILRLLGTGPDADGPPARPAALVRGRLFQEIERGSRAEVLARFAPYLPYFEGLDPIVDLGCGRGEFVELVAASGRSAYGVDSDPQAVQECVEAGFDVRREDLMEHLAELPASSVGGIFCAQVVEHLPPDLIPPLLEQVSRVLKPGGAALFETPNPATFATHVQSFWRDPTHIRPVPEATLSFAARSAGLVVEEVLYSSRPPDEERLQPLSVETSIPELASAVVAFNHTTERLNDVLFGFQDYAVLIRKPAGGPG